jgi:hypothetical protein
MSRTAFAILSVVDRKKAAEIIAKTPIGSVFEIRDSTRSVEQNNLMWGRLQDVSEQVDWNGEKYSKEDWKDMFTASLRRTRIVQNLDRDGFVQLGLHTSKLSITEMSNLLDLIDAFGAEHGLKFSDQPHQVIDGDYTRVDKKANRIEHTRLVENSTNSSESSTGTAYQDDDKARTPAADAGERGKPAAGVTHSELAEDWRAVYVQCLTGRRDKAASLNTRHSDALQMIGEPNAREEAWMLSARQLVARRNENRLKIGEFDAGLRELMNGPLPPAANSS